MMHVIHSEVTAVTDGHSSQYMILLENYKLFDPRTFHV